MKVGKKNKLTALLTLLAYVHLFIISHFLIVEGFVTNYKKPPALTRHALTLSLIFSGKGPLESPSLVPVLRGL